MMTATILAAATALASSAEPQAAYWAELDRTCPAILAADRSDHVCQQWEREMAGTELVARVRAARCDTATAWSEQVAPGVWRAVCGDDWGHELIGNGPSAYAALHHEMARSAGAEPDGAYEDAWAERADEERRGLYAIEPACRVGSEDSDTSHCRLEARACYDYSSVAGGWLETSCARVYPLTGAHPPTGAELRCYELTDEDAQVACLRGTP